jgi:hypothetical protein
MISSLGKVAVTRSTEALVMIRSMAIELGRVCCTEFQGMTRCMERTGMMVYTVAMETIPSMEEPGMTTSMERQGMTFCMEITKKMICMGDQAMIC